MLLLLCGFGLMAGCDEDGPFPGLGIAAARDIAWESQFNGRIISTSFYRDARNAWIATAKELGHNAGVVAQAWAAVGVIDRTVGRPVSVTLPGAIPNHPSIADALASCVAGDLIYVYSGTYAGDLAVSRANIVLVSKNRDSTIIDGTITVSNAADGFTIAGFTIDASSSTGGVAIQGTSGNPCALVGVSRCRFRNSRNGIVCSYVPSGQIVDNTFAGCSNESVNAAFSAGLCIRNNQFYTRGMALNKCNNPQITGNVLHNISLNGISLSSDCQNASISDNLFRQIGQSELVASSAITGISVLRNVWSDTSSTTLSLPSATTGRIARNSMVSNAYSVSVPSGVLWNDTLNKGNFWKDYAGKDLDGDSTGDTYTPHRGVDYDPLVFRHVSPLMIFAGDSLNLISSVQGDEFSLRGVVVGGAQSGLRIGGSTSLAQNGNIQCSQLLPGSNAWLDNSSDLLSGLTLRNAMGIPVMHFDSSGVIRTRSSFKPSM